MPSTQTSLNVKHALLIGSPQGGLKGPLNDVDALSGVLERCGFNITCCCDVKATREGILKEWQTLIDRITSSDVVLIYYSGHGGLVESIDEGPRSSYQFLVPIDYQDNDEDFRGILDVEVSHLLRQTTNKTHNVTFILDCCYSGNMARDPQHGDKAVSRALPKARRLHLARHEEKVRSGPLKNFQGFVGGNPHAVRVAAASPKDAAWEYLDENGKMVGALTKALVSTLENAILGGFTWRTLLFRVSELVTAKFTTQHPRVEGPHTRILFQMEEKEFYDLPVKIKDGMVTIQAGRVSGVRDGDIYTIMPYGSLQPSEDLKLGDAKVQEIDGFQTSTTFTPRSSSDIPDELAVAFIRSRGLYRWPISIPDGCPQLRERVRKSLLLRLQEKDEEVESLLEFRSEENSPGTSQEIRPLSGYNSQGLLCIPQQVGASGQAESLVLAAEKFCRARNLLDQRGGTGDEFLSHGVKVEFRLTSGTETIKTFNMDGTDSATEGNRALVTVHNRGKDPVFVSVFGVNVTGKIIHVTHPSPNGFQLLPAANYTVGQRAHSQNIQGQLLKWPMDYPKQEFVPDDLVFFVSSQEVDLRDFCGLARDPDSATAPRLQKLAHFLQTAQGRDFEVEDAKYLIAYDVIRVSWKLYSSVA